MIFYSPFQPGLFYDSMITSCAIQVNDTCLGQKHCFFVCVCGVTAWRCSDCLQPGLCKFQWSCASLLQENLEAVAKENKELQAQISQLAADLDGRILHRLEGE